MPRFSDSRLAQIARERFCPELPRALVAKAHRLVGLLEAARTWADLNFFTAYAQLPDGRLAIPAHGRWFITFNWSEPLGADEMRLEKL